MDVLIQCGGVALEYWPQAAATVALWLAIGDRVANLAAPDTRTAKVLRVLAAKVRERPPPAAGQGDA